MESLGVIGTGNMGRAILGGIVEAGCLRREQIFCYDRDKRSLKKIVKELSLQTVGRVTDLPGKCSSLLLAVKPQNLRDLSRDLKGNLDGKTLVISILAGTKVAALNDSLGKNIRVVRAMPNTPCLIGKGVTGLFASSDVTGKEKEFVLKIFSSIGIASFFDKEELIEVVTGFTGSGPAFIFVLIEALADAAVRCGLPRKEALPFALSLVEGSAALARETGIHPSKLKEMVMSPGGTTAEGVSVLEKRGFRGIIMEAVRAAYKKTESIK